MIHAGMTILYVADQAAAAEYYRSLFQLNPRLHVPGMTEFQLSESLVLGLMPIKGISRLLGQNWKTGDDNASPKAELYLLVEDAAAWLTRAVALGGRMLMDVKIQNWGDRVGYCLDPDGHVLAFAEPVN